MKTAWLLEAPGPMYVCVNEHGGFYWGNDPNAASQYESESDAWLAHELALDPDLAPQPGLFEEVGGGGNVSPREHGWPAAAVYPNRDIMHRFMGPPESCSKCGGRGWYHDDESPRERYCECPCGKERRRVDGAD